MSDKRLEEYFKIAVNTTTTVTLRQPCKIHDNASIPIKKVSDVLAGQTWTPLPSRSDRSLDTRQQKPDICVVTQMVSQRNDVLVH